MKYGVAVSLLLAAQSTAAFQGSSLFRHLGRQHQAQNKQHPQPSVVGLSVSTVLSEPANNNNNNTLYLANLVTDAVQTDDDEEEIELAERRRKITERSGTYRASLPLAQPSRGTKGVEEQPVLMGMCLRQFTAGAKIQDQVLDLDSLAIRTVPLNDPDMEMTPDIANKRIETIDSSLMKDRLGKEVSASSGGVYVSSVIFQSPAWNAGVRPGDILTASAATFGEALWPKTTLDGVRSALTSRRMVAGKATFEFQRTDVTAKTLDNVYELTLAKPIGLNLRETQDGYVEVVGFTMNAPTLVRRAVRLGDRVIAVDSSLGDQMWPVSTVEGVISACTGRLPGQKVTLRLERPEALLGDDASAAQLVMEPLTLPQEQSQTQQQSLVNDDEETQLLKRCRDVLRRYAADDQIQRTTRASNRIAAKFVDKFAVPAMVADRVMEALARASATLDSVTLSMTMDAYLSCGKPDDAIRAFEAAVGLNGNGSVLIPAVLADEDAAGTRIQPNAGSALNVYTISSLLKAHAMKQDLRSVRRVVAAMEGRGGEKVSGLETAAWPGTGEAGIIVPDAQCYNIAISAAAKTGSHEGLQLAMKLFDSLSEPSVVFKGQASGGKPEKTVVAYNSIIGALALAGKYDDAFNVFFTMKRVGIKPDKFTYTSLLKACVNDGDLQELLYDMQEQGVKIDVVMYNAMIRSLCDEGKLSEARTLITRMEAQGVAPDSKTYGILMNGLLKASKPGACLALFETACNNKRTSEFTENVYLYTTAVTAASLLGDHDRALDLVSRMSAVGVKPNMKTLTALMGACLSGDRPDLAAKVYKKIDSPDGYAMLQGLKAFCLSGDLDSAVEMVSTQRRGSRTFSGKQLMDAYEFVVTTAVESGDFEAARSAVTELLAKSYIPSKAMLRKVVGALGLVEKGQIVMDYDVDREPQQFDFLLFLIDSMRQRKLAVNAYLYAATITCGNQLGGKYVEVAELLMRSKAKYDEMGGRVVSLDDDSTGDTLDVQWTQVNGSAEILKNLATSPAILPAMDVAVSNRESRTVFFAEKFMTKPRQTNGQESPSPAMTR